MKLNYRFVVAIGIILFVVLFIIIYEISTADKGTMGDDDKTVYDEGWFNNTHNIDISAGDYIIVRNVIREYMMAINNDNPDYYNFGSSMSVSEDEISNRVYNMLSVNYINGNDLNRNNVFIKIKKYDSLNVISLLEISKLDAASNVKGYGIHILVQNPDNYAVIEHLYFIVYVDQKNNTFAVEPVSVSGIGDIKISNKIDKININDDNKYGYVTVSDSDVIGDYLDRFSKISIGMPEYVYNNYLNTQYRDVKFGSLDSFKKYVSDNYDMIRSLSLSKYNKNTSYKEYVQYSFQDKDGNYYVIREKNMVNFSIILDVYTLDLPEFVSNYERSKDKEKITMNMEKIREAINIKDYNYVYSKLNKSFRDSNFSDVNSLSSYLRNNYFDVNDMEVEDIQGEKNEFSFIVKVKNAKNESVKEKKYNFKMILGKGTSYNIMFEK